MKNKFLKAWGVLLLFFTIVLTISFLLNPHFPQLVIVGESSVGTWISGALLIISGSFCLITGMREGYIWFLITAFFFGLAMDERFMFHEQLKERLIFTFRLSRSLFWIYELPVILAALGGGFVAYLLWTKLNGISRIFLLCAVIFGTSSVVFDVFALGVLWEECFKLLAEVLISGALLKKVAS